MRLLRFSRPVSLFGVTSPPGDYAVEEPHAAAYLRAGLGRLLPGPGLPGGPLDPAVDWNGKRVLIGRSGGLGDLLFVTPVIREIRRRWPGVVLHAFSWPRCAAALVGNPHLDGLVSYPVPAAVAASHDACVWLEGVVEESPRARERHIVDLFADGAGISVADRQAVFRLLPGEAATAAAHFPKAAGRRRVGIHVVASTPVRSYPPRLTLEVTAALLARGWEVFLFGAPGEVAGTPVPVPGFVNLTLRTPPPTVRESAAILATCDAFVGPDSGLVHLAGALGIPAVALYGPFPARLRTAHAPSVTSLSGALPCAPCFHHSGPQLFPAGGPCGRSRECDALASIPPASVVAAVEALPPAPVCFGAGSPVG